MNKRIQTFKSILYFKQSKPPTCTCCGNPQRDVLQGIYYGYFKNQCKCKIESFKMYDVKYILNIFKILNIFQTIHFKTYYFTFTYGS
jgi:hypothetical protein